MKKSLFFLALACLTLSSCDNLFTGIYTVTSSSTIYYNYTSFPTEGPEYFAIHPSGNWMYQFWKADMFTLYDFSDRSFAVSMTFDRL